MRRLIALAALLPTLAWAQGIGMGHMVREGITHGATADSDYRAVEGPNKNSLRLYP
ncbi:hypothetical protein [Litorivicinus lipolyticus]|uniref:hypothetical protein n=1 Tax=Litorivicinus lipolyticus TaxID=418701 RepID=UPI003B5CECE3